MKNIFSTKPAPATAGTNIDLDDGAVRAVIDAVFRAWTTAASR